LLTVWLCVVWDFETINFQFTTNFICLKGPVAMGHTLAYQQYGKFAEKPGIIQAVLTSITPLILSGIVLLPITWDRVRTYL
jgi:hypothetical protein